MMEHTFCHGDKAVAHVTAEVFHMLPLILRELAEVLGKVDYTKRLWLEPFLNRQVIGKRNQSTVSPNSIAYRLWRESINITI